MNEGLMGEFSEKVFQVVAQIPRGKVATYGQVARLIGSPRSARYVGYALRNNPSPTALEFAKGLHDANKTDQLIPCHRVVFADGSLCKGFAFGGPEVQRVMLQDEGVTFVDDDHIDLRDCQWNGAMFAHNGEGVPIGAPTTPPADFDWVAELGE